MSKELFELKVMKIKLQTLISHLKTTKENEESILNS